MSTARKGERIGGAYFGGHVRPENRKADRKDRRRLENRNDKRQCVVLICERPSAGAEAGRTLATVVASEDGAMLADRGQTSAAMLADRGQTSAAMGFIKARLDRNTTVHADEAASWNDLHAHFDTRRVNHSVEYASADACWPRSDKHRGAGACVNHAESGFSRMRRAELGHHYHIAGPYLGRYAREMAWREDPVRDAC